MEPTSIASIVGVTGDDFISVFESFGSAFSGLVDFITSEPLLMFGLTFAAVAGLCGLVFKVSRKIGFKTHR